MRVTPGTVTSAASLYAHPIIRAETAGETLSHRREDGGATLRVVDRFWSCQQVERVAVWTALTGFPLPAGARPKRSNARNRRRATSGRWTMTRSSASGLCVRGGFRQIALENGVARPCDRVVRRRRRSFGSRPAGAIHVAQLVERAGCEGLTRFSPRACGRMHNSSWCGSGCASAPDT